jgi:hypothetical protein
MRLEGEKAFWRARPAGGRRIEQTGNSDPESTSCAGNLRVPAKPESLPLREAFLAFNDPALVENWRQVMQEAVPIPPIGPPYSADEAWRAEMLGAPVKPDPHLAALFQVQHARFDAAIRRRQEAWQALEPSFRAQVAAGEVVLEGLQCAPLLATARSLIPALWARLLIFNTASNKISTAVQGVEFVDVTARRVMPQIGVPQSAAVLAEGPLEEIPAAPPRPRGRESYEPLIEEALRANWDEVQRRLTSREQQRPNWSELAVAMHRRLVRGNRNSGAKVPHVQTIRTRLPGIYARVLSENPVRK